MLAIFPKGPGLYTIHSLVKEKASDRTSLSRLILSSVSCLPSQIPTKAAEDGASEREIIWNFSLYSSGEPPATSSQAMNDLATRCEDTQTAALSLSMLNTGYSSGSVSEKEGELERVPVLCRSGVSDEKERVTFTVETPQKAARPNPGKRYGQRMYLCRQIFLII